MRKNTAINAQADNKIYFAVFNFISNPPINSDLPL